MRKREDVRAREYRLRAQHCLDIAMDLDGVRKVVLLDMAQAWMRLAEQAKRNQSADVVYETPPTDRQAVASPAQPQRTFPDRRLPSP